MKLILHIVVLIIFIYTTKSTLHDTLRDSVMNILKNRKKTKALEEEIHNDEPNENKDDQSDDKLINTVNELDNVKRREDMNFLPYPRASKQGYILDPGMNLQGPFRRLQSSLKKAWQGYYKGLKEKAVKEPYLPPGDSVNMLNARPWDVRCGDANQHDMPWGTCMLAAECEQEDRIYRGDEYCGRTEFVCCSLLVQNYDIYQGNTFSFEDKGVSSNTEELYGPKQLISSKKDRIDRRKKRKKNIRKTIRKIINEIRKILNKTYKNGTKTKEKKTKTLSKFVKNLKNTYKKNRKLVQEIHSEKLTKVDATLMKKLKELEGVNLEFMKNDTFRDIVLNGTITQTGARMLIDAYPEMVMFIGTRRSRGAGGDGSRADDAPNFDGMKSEDYDVEYGYLYE